MSRRTNTSARGRIQSVSISPVTSQDIRAVGWSVAAEAAEATVEGILSALVALAGKKPT